MPDHQFHVGIIGAGVIGVSTACFLAENGCNVTLIAPQDAGEGGASKGNAAQVFPALIYPLASPTTLKSAFAMLSNPLGPLFIRPYYLPRLMSWLGSFAYAARPSNFQRATTALTELNRDCYTDFCDLLARAGCGGLIKNTGAIQLYESRQTLTSGLQLWRRVPEALSGGVELLDSKRVRDMEPALGACVKGGVLIRLCGTLTDPSVVVASLFDYARRTGDVVLEVDRARRILPFNDTVVVDTESGRSFVFDRLVLAAGVWSNPLLRQLNEPHNLQAERGYNLTLPTPNAMLSHNLVFAERGVVGTSLQTERGHELRLGGWDEFAGSEAPPNPNIFSKMERLAQLLLPGFDWSSGARWMGHRSSLPDTLPVIGQSRKHPSIYYGFGHGHLGMTQGPTTGKAIASLITGASPALNLRTFAPR